MKRQGRGHLCEYCDTVVDPPPQASPFDVFRDSDGDGTPDLFEGAGASSTIRSHSVTTSYTFNDVEYSSLDEMPPEVRAHFESATDLLAGLREERAPPPPRQPPERPPRRHPRRRIQHTDDPVPRDHRTLLIALMVAVVLALLFFALR